MDRRDFLTVSASSAMFVALPNSKRDPLAQVNDALIADDVDMDAYVRRVDDGIARIEQWQLTEMKVPSDTADEYKAAERLARSSLQSLFITGMLGDLPLHSQLDERMQERVQRMAPKCSEAVDGMTAFLSSRTTADFAHASATLQDGAARKRIVDTLVNEAERTGVSTARRRQLRMMLENVTWRLASQPPALVVNEYLEKVERASASNLESEARERALAARVGEQLFWEQNRDDKKPRTREEKQKRALHVLGIGALTFAVSGGLVAVGAFPAVFGMTVGAIMVLVGLIMLLDAGSAPRAATPPSTSR